MFHPVYRATPHAPTRKLPALLLHGRIPRIRLGMVGHQSKRFFLGFGSWDEGTSRASESREAMAESDLYRLLQRSMVLSFKEGDKVHVRHPTHCGKMALRFGFLRRIQSRVQRWTYKLDNGRSWNASKLSKVPQENSFEQTPMTTWYDSWIPNSSDQIDLTFIELPYSTCQPFLDVSCRV